MVIKNTILVLLLLFSFSIKAQEEISAKLIVQQTFVLEKFIGIDKYANTYAIHQNVFLKYEGGKEYRFYDVQLGKPTSVDIINPLKITLFYEDMNTVVIVDNRLNEINRINFNTLTEFKNLGFATTATDRSLWIFNIDLQQLELFDYNRKKTEATTQPISTEIIQQQSNFNFCWLLTKNHLERYNRYGSLTHQFQQKNITQFQEHNGNLIALNNNKLYRISEKDGTMQPIAISEITVKDFYLNNENLYLYDENFIYHYQLELPN